MAVVKLIYQIACVKVLACFPSIMWLLLGTFRYPAKKNFSAYECNMKLVTAAETSLLKLSCALLTSSGLIANIIMHKGAHTNSLDNLNQDSSRHARTTSDAFMLLHHINNAMAAVDAGSALNYFPLQNAYRLVQRKAKLNRGSRQADACYRQQSCASQKRQDSKAVQSKQHGKIVQYSGQLGCQLAQRTFELGECQSTTNISSYWWYAIICKCTWVSLWT